MDNRLGDLTLHLYSELDKRNQCLHITQNDPADPQSLERHPLVEYTRAEHERADIIRLDLLDDAYKHGRSITKEEEEEDRLLKEAAEKKHKVWEHLNLANSELDHLVYTTKAIQNKNNNLNVLPIYRDSMSKVGPQLLSEQKMGWIHNKFREIEPKLEHAIENMESIIANRNIFLKKVDMLQSRLRWRIIKSQKQTMTRASIHPQQMQNLIINCEFNPAKSKAKAPSSMYAVPLLIGNKGQVCLSREQVEQPLRTLVLQIHINKCVLDHCNSSSNSANESGGKTMSATCGPASSHIASEIERVLVAQCTLWDLHSRHANGNDMDVDDVSDGIDVDVQFVNDYCKRRLHDNKAMRIFAAIAQEAPELKTCDRWIVAPTANLRPITAGKEDTTFPYNNDVLLEVLRTQQLFNSLDILILNRGMVKIALSPHVTLTLSLNELADIQTVNSQEQLHQALGKALEVSERVFERILEEQLAQEATEDKKVEANMPTASMHPENDKPEDEVLYAVIQALKSDLRAM